MGPSDLSITLSKGAGIDKTGPATLAAMEKIVGGGEGNGLVAGAFGGRAEVDQDLSEARLHLHRGGGRCRTCCRWVPTALMKSIGEV